MVLGFGFVYYLLLIKLLLQFLLILDGLFTVDWDPPVPETSCWTSEGKYMGSQNILWARTSLLLLQLYFFSAAGLWRGYKEEWCSTIHQQYLYLYGHICHLAVGYIQFHLQMNNCFATLTFILMVQSRQNLYHKPDSTYCVAFSVWTMTETSL